MKKLSDKNSISKTAKLLFFIKYIFSNLFTFSFLPRKKIRIFSINYLSTVINYTYNRKLYFDVNYTSEKWHKINENNNFDFDEWKYNIFDKRRHLAIKFLVNEINSNNKKKISILEVGCGAGEVGAKLISKLNLDKKISYIGLDISKSEIEKGKKGFKKFFKNKNVIWKFLYQNFFSFNLRNKHQFDYVFCVSVLEMMNETQTRKFINKMCDNSKNSIFINENYETFLKSNPRNHKDFNKYFVKNNFQLYKHMYKIQKINRKNIRWFEFMRIILLYKKMKLEKSVNNENL